MKTISRLFIVLLLCVCGFQLFGDEYHYVNAFLGDRASGMAGAYTAIADGPEGAYYNPAGLVFTSSRYFSLSTNAFQYSKNDYLKIAGTNLNYARESTSFIPNFFGFVQKGDRTAFGFIIATTDNEATDQRDVLSLINPASTSEKLEIHTNFFMNRTVNEMGPAFSLMLGDSFSIGLGSFMIYTDSRAIFENVRELFEVKADGTQSWDNYFQLSTLYKRKQKFAIKPQFGIQLMPSDTISVGYSISSEIPLYSIYNVQTSKFLLNPFKGQLSSNVIDNVSWSDNISANGFFDDVILKNTLGVAWFASKSLLLSCDAQLHYPLHTIAKEQTEALTSTSTRKYGVSQDAVKNDTSFIQVDGVTKYYRPTFFLYPPQLTWNVAVGLEWYVNPYFPFRFGVYTNNANTPDLIKTDSANSIRGTSDLALEKTNQYGCTFSFGYTTADTSINIGGSFSYGTGNSQLGGEGLETMNTMKFSIFLSGGYQY